MRLFEEIINHKTFLFVVDVPISACSVVEDPDMMLCWDSVQFANRHRH